MYISGRIETKKKIGIPEGKRIPFHWNAVAIDWAANEGEVLIRWDSEGVPSTALNLRITVALDVREEIQVEVFLPKTKKTVGTFDIRYAYVLQPFEIEICSESAGECFSEGIGMRMVKGNKPLWIFADAQSGGGQRCIQFEPHLLIKGESDKPKEFNDRMVSLASIQPFGWMEGCVLEGLYEMSLLNKNNGAANAICSHLDRYGIPAGELVYENPQSEPVDGKIYGIEATLPFAVIARMDVRNAAQQKAVDFWINKYEKKGLIYDNGCLSAEGSYTVAYPLSVFGKATDRQELCHIAVKELLIRRDKLVCGDDVYLRYMEDGSRTFKNWARAYSWYMLGLVDTIRTLGGNRELEEEFQRVSAIALKCVGEEGVWSCFLKEPETGVETSGSAGIAAAFAKGVRLGILDEEYDKCAEKACNVLKKYMTQDGFLRGVSQMNRGGEELQRNGYRVISQMGMGLLAQLIANTKNQFLL